MSNARLVVTGAAGMVGQNLVPRLCDLGYQVIGLDKNRSALNVLASREPRATLHTVDLADPGEWMRLFAGASAVIDLKAQITSPDRALHLRNNALATSSILEACSRNSIPHLVHLSSSVVLSKADDFYTESKRLGEESVRESAVPHTILRPPLMYGPGDVKHLGLVLRMMERFPILPVPGDGRYLRQPLYVGDMCGVIEAILPRAPMTEIFDVIGHERIMFIDLLRTIRSIRGLRCRLIPVPIVLFRSAMAAQRLMLGRVMFTGQQLTALTAGDDFAVENWSERFGVSYSPFVEMAPKVYGSDDDLRGKLLAATAAQRLA